MLRKQMQYFVSVVQCHSFTQAAEQNYISQSAISQQIQALENELQTPLLLRQGRTFTVTEAGTYFYQQAKILLAEMDKLIYETRNRATNTAQSLKIGYPRYYNGVELHQAMETFSLQYPHVEMDIVHGTHEELYDMLRFGKLDFVLNDQRRVFSEEYINCELLQCECFIELSARNAHASKARIEMSQLKDMTCILIAPKEQQVQERSYYQDFLGFQSNVIFADSLEEGRLMVAGNRGYLPMDGIGTILPVNSTMARLPLYRGKQRMHRNYCSFWKKENENPYIEPFATILCELFEA